jgi:hypothetical protein
MAEDDSLVGFILDQLRRSRTSDIADQLKSGQIQPQDALQALASATGDPKALEGAAQQSALSKLNSGNPNVNSLLPFMAPNDAIGALTNPMLMQGNPAPNASALSAINSQNAPAQPVSGLDNNYLNTQVPPFYRNQVKDVIQGGELAKDVSPKDRTLIMNWAHNVDPSFTETKGTMRNKMSQDMVSNTPNSQGGLATQINSVMGHLYDLHETSHELNNGPSPPLNWLGQMVTETGVTGEKGLAGISNYNTILERASPELNKFYVGGEGDKEGRASAKEAFSPLLPDNIIKKNVRTQLGLLESKANTLQSTRDKIMGNASSPVLIPTAQALMDDINGKQLTPEQQALVNAHRQKSNLPPKTWGDSQPKQQAKPQISKDDALAELRRRGKIK